MTRWVGASLVGAALAAALSGCVPLVVGGGMAATALSASDRRTTGIQVEDEGIELRVRDQLMQARLDEQVRINITSFNRRVLITGEARTAQARQAVERLVRETTNVQHVFDEVSVTPLFASLSQRSKDTVITGQVKASLLNAQDLQGSAIKVVTEMNVVYLMGIVSEREAKRAAEIARGINDVRKVVRVFEVVSEDALAGYARRTQ